MKKLFKTLVLAGTVALMLTGCSSNTDKPVETEDVSTTNEPTEKEPVETENILYFTDEEIEYAKKIAIPLTDNIIRYGFTQQNENGENKIQQIGKESMILALWKYDESHPYYNLFNYDIENSHILNESFSKNNLNKMIFQLFGDSEFKFTSIEFNENTQLYDTSLEFGINNQYSYENLNIYYREPNRIEAEFNLFGENEGPGDFSMDKGVYKINYNIIKDNEGNLFLRYEECLN